MTRVHHVLTGVYRPWDVQTDHLGIYQLTDGVRDYLTAWREGEREVTIHFGTRIITYKHP